MSTSLTKPQSDLSVVSSKQNSRIHDCV